MYEVCMSADDRIEPTFDNNPHEEYQRHITQSAPITALTFEENKGSDTVGLLIKSGMVMLIATSLYAGYIFFKPSTQQQPISSLEQQKNEQQEKNQAVKQKEIRKIDLTKTASIKKSDQKSDNALSNDALIVKPVKTKKLAARVSQTYIVKSGDTLSKIGKTYNTSPKAIMEINNITDARSIKPGMKLVLTR